MTKCKKCGGDLRKVGIPIGCFSAGSGYYCEECNVIWSDDPDVFAALSGNQ